MNKLITNKHTHTHTYTPPHTHTHTLTNTHTHILTLRELAISWITVKCIKTIGIRYIARFTGTCSRCRYRFRRVEGWYQFSVGAGLVAVSTVAAFVIICSGNV